MSDSSDGRVTKNRGPGFWESFGNYFKLVFRLMGDRRVNPLLKLIPLLTLVYLVSPDFLPFIIDDSLIIWLGTYLFVELCPQEVVEEHRAAMNRQKNVNSGGTGQTDKPQGEVIDAEYWEVKKDDS